MTRGLADTSLFIARETQRAVEVASLPEELAVSAVTLGELRAGVLVASDTATRVRRLETLTHALALDPLPVDALVAEAWAGLRVRLRESGRRMPVNDSWIAATALVWDLAVVTQDDDYSEVPGLSVIRV